MTNASDSTSPSALDPLATATALAGLRKAQADADSAEAAAATAKVKAAFGDAPSGPYTGAVNKGDGAALAEMNFLARKALQSLADSIVGKLEPLLVARTAVLIAGAAPASYFAHIDALQARLDIIREACERAKGLCEAVPPPHPALRRPAAGPGTFKLESLVSGIGIAAAIGGAVAPGPIAAAGAALMGANALLGFFRSNTAIGGAAITVADRTLILAVAGRLRAKRSGLAILLDGFLPPASAPARAALAKSIDDLAELAGALDAAAVRVEAEIAAASKTAQQAGPKGGAGASPHEEHAEPADPPPSSLADLDPRRDALAAAKRASAMFDALQTDLFADAGGAPLIERAAMEQTLRDRLGDSPLLVSLALEGSWGSHISREGMFSGLGSKIPMHVSATSAANWAAFDMASGDLLGASLETSHSPLTNIADVGS